MIRFQIRSYLKLLPLIISFICINIQSNSADANEIALALERAPEPQEKPTPPAPPQKEHITALYNVYWSGFNVADLLIDINQTTEKYDMRIAIETYGLAYSFTKFTTRAHVSGDVLPGGGWQPRKYFSKHRWRDKITTINFEYDADGKMISHSHQPPINHHARPKVKPEESNGTYDPISAYLLARYDISNAIKAIHAGKPYNRSSSQINVFDGRRVANVGFDIIDKIKRFHINGKKQWTRPVRMWRQPVAGFKPKELKEDTTDVVIFFARSYPYLPLMLEADSPAGEVYARFERYCHSYDECLKEME